LYISINKDNTKVTAFANINGISDKVIPYISHEKTPAVKIINIYRDISFVLFVFQTFTACGKKAKVVQNAAKKPMYFNIKFKIIIF